MHIQVFHTKLSDYHWGVCIMNKVNMIFIHTEYYDICHMGYYRVQGTELHRNPSHWNKSQRDYYQRWPGGKA